MEMKRIHTISSAMLATAMLLATACTVELMNGDDTAANAVQIASATVGDATDATPQTRAAIDATEFATGDVIALSTTTDGAEKGTYTKTAEGWANTAPLQWGSTYPATYYACYPATATYTDFALPADQSGTGTDDNSIERANYMTATTTIAAKPADKSLSLNFGHRTAQVVIRIVGRAGNDNNGSLGSPQIYSPRQQVSGSGSATPFAITPLSSTQTVGEQENVTTYTALVAPGNASGFRLFTVKMGGETTERTFTTDINLEANHIYTYDITIGADRLTLSGLTVSDWTEKTATGTIKANWIDYAANAFAGGTGTETDPYQISSAEQLAHLAKMVNEGSDASLDKYYKLTADINLSGKLWTPIGQETPTSSFRGSFDGGGYTISGLTIRATTDFAGLFGRISSSLPIKDVHLANANVCGHGYVGTLAGYIRPQNDNGYSIIGCTAKGSVTGTGLATDRTDNCVGGLIGYSFLNYNVLIFACATDVAVGISGSHAANVGGLVGSSYMNALNSILHLAACYVGGSVAQGAGTQSAALAVGKSERNQSAATSGSLTNCAAKQSGYAWINGDKVTTANCEAGVASPSYAKAVLTASISDKIVFGGKIYKPAEVMWNENSDGARCPLIPDEYTPDNYAPPTNIATLADLKELRDWVNLGNSCDGKDFTLAADINLANEDWTPIGYGTNNKFMGNFDGKGHKISNLKITAGGTNDGVGLFGRVSSTITIKNLTIDGVDINSSAGAVGALIGIIYGGSVIIDNCHVTGTSPISGTSSTGGIIGRTNYPLTMSRCSSTANVTSGITAGGLIGEAPTNVSILACFSTGNVHSSNTSIYYCCAGGLVGNAYYSFGTVVTISGCYTTGTVTGAATNSESETNLARVGRLAGLSSKTMTMSYCAATVSNGLRLIGRTGENATLTNCNDSDDWKHIGDLAKSAIYGIVSNASNTDTFTGGDGNTYKVKDCWTNVSGFAPTLKVNADGTTK